MGIVDWVVLVLLLGVPLIAFVAYIRRGQDVRQIGDRPTDQVRSPYGPSASGNVGGFGGGGGDSGGSC